MASRKINSVLATFLRAAATAWFDGYKAYEQGEPLSADPHPSGSLEHLLWADGWEAARKEFGGA